MYFIYMNVHGGAEIAQLVYWIGYGVDSRGIGVSIPERSKRFFPLRSVQIGSEAHQVTRGGQGCILWRG